MVVRSEVPLLPTVNVPRADEVKKGRDGGESFRLEPVDLFVLIRDVGRNFKFLAPGRALRVFINYALYEILSLLTQICRLVLPNCSFNHTTSIFLRLKSLRIIVPLLLH